MEHGYPSLPNRASFNVALLLHIDAILVAPSSFPPANLLGMQRG
jgi:hypothetical protein